MTNYASSDLVSFGMLDEGTPGVFETSAPYQTVITRGITPDFPGNILADDSVHGAGEPIDNQTNLRGFGLTTPAYIRYQDVLGPLVAPACRDLAASPVAVIGTADIDVVTNATLLSGAVGTQIRTTSLTLFDDLIGYAGATPSTHPRGGAEALVMRITGFGNSANNWHRRIQAVWKDGSGSYIDIMPGWVGGITGFFGEPMAATAGESPTIQVGRAVRNRITGSGVVTKSALWQFTDMVNNGRFSGGSGLAANDLTINWSGKEGAGIEVNWVGEKKQALAAVDPSGQGFVDANLYSEMMTAADQLDHFAIITAVEPIVLSCLNLSSFSFTLAGNTTSQDGVSGCSTPTGVTRGSHVPSGSIDYLLADDSRSEKLAALGDQATAAKGEISFMFRDRKGNEIPVGILWNEFGQTGPIPGSPGNTVGGSIEFSGQRLTNSSRSFVWQEIPGLLP